jgi:hypothetical protein
MAATRPAPMVIPDEMLQRSRYPASHDRLARIPTIAHIR